MTENKNQEQKYELLILPAFIIGIAVIELMSQITLASMEPIIELKNTHISREPEVKIIDVNKGTIREVTAYNLVKEQTDETPCLGASRDNICELLDRGMKICAANFVPLGSKLYIDKIGECLVLDRMNSMFSQRVDVAMKAGEIERAKRFGLQKLNVITE